VLPVLPSLPGVGFGGVSASGASAGDVAVEGAVVEVEPDEPVWATAAIGAHNAPATAMEMMTKRYMLLLR
jgi:hypothetical protein